MNEELSMQLKAIYDFSIQCTIPIIVEPFENKVRKAGIIGTGTLFKFFDNYYLITAHHVLKDMYAYKKHIGIPSTFINSDILTLGTSKYHFPSTKQQQDIYDIGIIQLDPELSSKLKYRFLTFENIMSFQGKHNAYICGFPQSFSNYSEKNEQIISKPFCFMTRTLQHSDFTNIDRKSKHHIYLKYSNTIFADGTKETISPKVDELKGISGCTIWNYNEDNNGIWTAEKSLKVLGVQFAVNISQRYIIGLSWNIIAQAFSQIDKSISKKLISCMQ